MPTRAGLPGKHDALLYFLQALPHEQLSVVLTFPAIEALLGVALPPGAWNSSHWHRRVNGYASAWTQAGFAAQLVHSEAPRVEFRRVTKQQR